LLTSSPLCTSRPTEDYGIDDPPDWIRVVALPGRLAVAPPFSLESRPSSGTPGCPSWLTEHPDPALGGVALATVAFLLLDSASATRRPWLQLGVVFFAVVGMV